MSQFLECSGGNPGRSGHRLSIDAGRVVFNTREALAELFNAPDPMRVFFTSNATHAINLGLMGLLKPGDHVVTSGMEHNSVMRPLRALECKGVQLTVVPCGPDGSLRPEDIAGSLTPFTKMVTIAHASNVSGTVLPVSEISEVVHRVGALLLVDAAQTAGVLSIDIQKMGIDLLAFTGHKGLQGPPGTGGLILGQSVDAAEMEPLMRGGTGSRSEFEFQPEDFPDKFESGTLNGAGIAGLGAGIRWILDRGLDAILGHETELKKALLEGLGNIPGITVYGPQAPSERTAVISFTARGHRVSDIGFVLDEEYGVLTRVGLHCAPAAHRTIGTFPDGTVRFAPGVQTTAVEVSKAIEAVARIMRSGR